MPNLKQIAGVGMPAYGYNAAYGGVPIIPTTQTLSGTVQNVLNNAIPGFSGLTKSASGVIGSALGGQLPRDVQEQIQNAGATQAVMGGMPGSSRLGGSFFGNRTLRDIGLTSLQRQDTGLRDLLSLIQGYSGTVVPNVGQTAEQENARAQFAAAPIPMAASQEQQRIYDKYSNPTSDVPWWLKPGAALKPGQTVQHGDLHTAYGF